MKPSLYVAVAAFGTMIYCIADGAAFIGLLFGGVMVVAITMAYIYCSTKKEELRRDDLQRRDHERA